MGSTERLACPKCSSPEVRRSRRRGAGEHVLGIIGIAPYRCFSCFWRGYGRLRRDGSLSPRSFTEEGLIRFFAVALQLFVLALAVAISLFVVYLTRG